MNYRFKPGDRVIAKDPKLSFVSVGMNELSVIERRSYYKGKEFVVTDRSMFYYHGFMRPIYNLREDCGRSVGTWAEPSIIMSCENKEVL